MASREETVARKMFDLLADVRLDTRMLGFYLAYSPDPNLTDILDEVLEATVLTKQDRESRLKVMILGDDNGLE